MLPSSNDSHDNDSPDKCIVCGWPVVGHFASVENRDYFRCGRCRATFLDPRLRLSLGEEYQHYRTHQNDPRDPGYRRFLSQLTRPLLRRLPPSQEGLDYGCGPGPALAIMLRRAGYSVDLYDPFFCPNEEVLARCYDFITCTEVAEHFRNPAWEFARLGRLLRPGGWLAVMTRFLSDDSRFASWHYRRDPTHVVFYHETTLRTLACDFGWRCEIPTENIAIYQKPMSSNGRLPLG